ncbi:M23 family metallopeptidase [Microvirga sp. HBU67558]|uniref:M23 family metallopeptidase n=1 Tax=Microvirga TaxID=186650 RepID=UPI001B3885CB|nr:MULTISPECIES: M23 family metallopeptidase [unclassified Microvirga]MBQ0822678.1 M23 family metallopeptidase [Microvirga sp. HBU67558]
MTRLSRGLVAAVSLIVAPPSPAAAQEAFLYHSPGNLAVGAGRENDRTIYLPGLLFPLAAGPAFGNAHAYANSQIHPSGGPGNSEENYAYPWRDTYCEKRSWDMPLCPGKTGHQGLDIRPQRPERNAFPALAMDNGVVTSITSNTTVTIRSNANYYCRYLHLDRDSITQAGLKVGAAIRRGDVVGKVSNIMGGIPNTTIHLHFDCHKTINGRTVRLPIYASVVAAYRRAWQLDPLDTGGSLGVDPIRELSIGAKVSLRSDSAADAKLPKSIRTKNFGAITPQTEPASWPLYIRRWPDLLPDVEIRDAFGKIIPAFASPEAGVGLWWYWIVQRAGFGAAGTVSFEKIAVKYSGASSPSEPVVAKYAGNYSGTAEKPGLSSLYFGRFVNRAEDLNLADAEVRWNIARTIFHYEAGRQDVVDRSTFDRGIQLANMILQKGFDAPLPGPVTDPSTPLPPGVQAPLAASGGSPVAGTAPSSGMEIVLGRYVIRVGQTVDSAALSRVLDVLESRR